MELAALIILIIFSVVGFAAIFFTTFGTLLILIGSVLHGALTGFSILGLKTLLVLCTFYLCGEVLEYVFVIVGAKKFGASNAATVGAILGGGVSITNIQLPDGTILPPLKPSISIGIAEGVSVFNSMTIWDLVYTF